MCIKFECWDCSACEIIASCSPHSNRSKWTTEELIEPGMLYGLNCRSNNCGDAICQRIRSSGCLRRIAGEGSEIFDSRDNSALGGTMNAVRSECENWGENSEPKGWGLASVLWSTMAATEEEADKYCSLCSDCCCRCRCGLISKKFSLHIVGFCALPCKSLGQGLLQKAWDGRSWSVHESIFLSSGVPEGFSSVWIASKCDNARVFECILHLL